MRRGPPRGVVRQPNTRSQVDAASRAEVLIQRYLAVLEADPRETFAFQRLLDLFRERDGNIDGLVRQLQERLTTDPDAYAPRMILGHVLKARGRVPEAEAAYQRASELRPEEPAPLISLAQLALAAGAHVRVRELYGRALELTSADADKQEILRQLGAAALSMEDWDAARGYYQRLARGAHGSVYLLTEYARALVARDQHSRAVAEYDRVIARLRGDNRVLSPILREKGAAQLAAGDANAAIQTLERALRLAGQTSGVRVEIYDTLLDAYRGGDRLPELAAQLARRGQSFEVQELLGRIHDELGNEEEALAAYRRALARSPRHIDTRVRVIQLLSRSGRIEDVIHEYEALIRRNPREPRFVVELANLLMQVGRRDEALRRAAQTSRRHPREPVVHQAIAELYSRWGEDELAAREVAHLARIEPNDPAHLVALGAQQLEAGNRRGAIATWRRILHTVNDRAEAHAALGAVYADHDMLEEAIREYEEAVRLAPLELPYARGLANSLERLRRNDPAVTAWERVMALAGEDRAAQREARQRIVGIWARSRRLGPRIAELRARFGATPPDVEAGRFLAEAHRRAGVAQAGDAERVLTRIIALEPGDVSSMLVLERVRTSRGDLAGAIEVLGRLVEADARRAPRYLTRMAEHSLALYRDEDAIRYAAEAVARTPDDANAHRRLGDLYRARQDNGLAMASYRRAIELNDRLFPTYFDLAEIHLARAEFPAADQLFRQVIRASPDDDLVGRAARASIQIHLGDGTLEILEGDLLPLALGHPQRPVYRKLVIELYDGLTSPWIDAVHRTEGAAHVAAMANLQRLGNRALKPLLEALADDDPAQRRVAITILGHLGNDNAAAPLLAVAEADGDMGSRSRALIAAGAVASAELAPRFVALAEGPERRLRGPAGWGLARIGGPAGVSAMRGLLIRGDPSVRAFAALGLGRAGDRGSAQALGRLLRTDRSVYVQAAAAWALGELGDPAHVQTLVVMVRTRSGIVAVAATGALGKIRDVAARGALAEALFDEDLPQRRAAAVGLHELEETATRTAPSFPVLMPGRTAGGYVRAITLAMGPEALGPTELSAYREVLTEAASVALRGPVERARAALEVLGEDGAGLIALGPLTEGLRDWPSAERNAAEEELSVIAVRLVPDFLRAASHPDPGVRSAVVALLARFDQADARAAVARALDDDEVVVRRVGLASLHTRHQEAIPRVTMILSSHGEWSLRTLAAETLGRMGAEAGRPALEVALAGDEYAFVREAAARALGVLGGTASQVALRRAAQDDGEPTVRAAARAAIAAPRAE